MPKNLTHTTLDCGRKLEHPEETHVDTMRACKLHTDSDPRLELNLGPWRCEAAALTTVLLCHPLGEKDFPQISYKSLALYLKSVSS